MLLTAPGVRNRFSKPSKQLGWNATEKASFRDAGRRLNIPGDRETGARRRDLVKSISEWVGKNIY